MQILTKHTVTEDYIQVFSSEDLWNVVLSYKAIGLFITCILHFSDRDFLLEDIMAFSKECEATIKKYLKELEKNGFLAVEEGEL